MNNSSGILDHERFLVFGAARSGMAAARLLRSRGKRVALFDEAPLEELRQAEREADEIGAPLFSKAEELGPLDAWEVLVLSPGIPTNHPVVALAEKSGLLVRSEIEIGYHACPAPIVAITGTNGKTTVTHLVAHLLERAGRPVCMAGNVGRPLCDAVLDPILRRNDARVVCEVSSFQLETIERFAPRIACVLNVSPDHLDRHSNLANYIEAKYRITENQTADDVLVLNGDDRALLSFAARTSASVWLFSVNRPLDRGAFLRDEVIRLAGAGAQGKGNRAARIMPRSDIPLPGLHNVENVLAALTIGASMGLDPAAMADAVRSFRPVPHRIELVGEIGGARYYNDSKATNLVSLGKALDSFEEPIVLIAGGRDKGSPWEGLNDRVARRVKGLVLIGEAAPIARAAWGGLVPRVEDAPSMAEAVARARAMAAPGDIVLLSPACSSFDMYRNYEERGDDFREIVRRQIGNET